MKMRREHSSPTMSLTSSPKSSELRLCDYRRLNFVAFASTLIYIGYLIGSVENGSQVVTSAFNIGRADRGGVGADGDPRGLRATSPGTSREDSPSRDLPDDAKRKADDARKKADGGESSRSDKKAEERGPSYAKGPVINDHVAGKGTSISLIGERHSGTNWITDHLEECFGDQIKVEPDFTRFKHWFQFDDATVRNDSAVVVAMFRDPYDWVEAMREHPHHAHGHIGIPDTIIGMEWKDFVTKPWVGPRGRADRKKMEKARKEGYHIDKWGCLAGYRFDEVIPCSSEDSVNKPGYSSYMYELRNDGSHRAYNSIVELRTAKIQNFLRVSTFHGVKAFFPERYEALNLRGTADFLHQLEEVTGLKASCDPLAGTGVVKHKDVDPEFTSWMNKYHDWETEGLIGYVRRDPVTRREPPPEAPEGLEAPKSNAQVH